MPCNLEKLLKIYFIKAQFMMPLLWLSPERRKEETLHLILMALSTVNQKLNEILPKYYPFSLQIKLDITPDKGWEIEDMFLPPGYHINAEIEGVKKASSPEQPQEAYNYPAGMGSVIMNGCWGTGYKKGDPCFDALGATGQCRVSHGNTCSKGSEYLSCREGIVIVIVKSQHHLD